MAHRAAWCLYHGEWPAGVIDHINGDKTDNRIENLRCVTPSINSRNMKKFKHNTSGIAGVCWHKASNKWRAIVTVGGRQKSLGVFSDKDDAAKAVARSRRELGFTERHGT
jgi:hypothetical protein